MPLDVAVNAQRRIDIVMKNITDGLWAKKKLANFQQGLEIAIVLNAFETDDSCWSYARTNDNRPLSAREPYGGEGVHPSNTEPGGWHCG